VTRFIFNLLIFVLFYGPNAYAEFAKVEGRTNCSTLGGKVGCSFAIWLSGEIASSTVNEVKELLDRRRAWTGGEQGNLFYIDSPGGNVAAAMAIGRMIRKERLTVLVWKGQECLSACVIVLVGATHRGFYGKIGIHRPFFDPPISSQPLTPDKVKDNYQSMLQEIRSYLREMNVSERLVDDMLAIDPANVRYLSRNQLENYGLRTVDPIEQETIDLQEAQALGLDRREFIRRKALSLAKCSEDSSLETLDAILACNERIMKSGR
jgi:hypothetical protein